MKKRFGIRIPMALLLLPCLGPALPVHVDDEPCVETSEPLPAQRVCGIIIGTCATVGVDESTQKLCFPVDID